MAVFPFVVLTASHANMFAGCPPSPVGTGYGLGDQVRGYTIGSDWQNRDWIPFDIDSAQVEADSQFLLVFDTDYRYAYANYFRITDGVREISFTARVEQQLGPRIYHEMPYQEDSFVVKNVRYGDVSPDGSTLVFGSLNQLWLMNLPDGEPRPLVVGGEGQYQPTFSPDGTSISFVSWHATDGGHLWRVPAQGGTPERLTTNPAYYAMIDAFNERTGCGVVVNTSFNVRGEPIVCTPADSYRCFMRTEMDFLVIENFLLDKTQQPEIEKDDSWKDEFELD